ncbi:MAG: hypothetical protein IIC53_12500 [Proteobacteria bacterium]|nr:hypothetical protein [Pseudomonadota bacterium]
MAEFGIGFVAHAPLGRGILGGESTGPGRVPDIAASGAGIPPNTPA